MTHYIRACAGFSDFPTLFFHVSDFSACLGTQQLVEYYNQIGLDLLDIKQMTCFITCARSYINFMDNTLALGGHLGVIRASLGHYLGVKWVYGHFLFILDQIP